VVTATVDVEQRYCDVLEFIVVTATVVIVQWYFVVLAFIVVTATVGIVQCYCVVCRVYCGDINSRYSSMLLCCVWRLLW